MEVIKKAFEAEDEEMDKHKIEYSEGLGAPLAFKRLLSKAAGVIALEDFYPGTVTQRIGQWHDEVIIVSQGTAEWEYSFPTGVGIWEKKTVTVEAGDCIFLYRGEQWSLKVTSKERFRHLCIIMPQHPFPQRD